VCAGITTVVGTLGADTTMKPCLLAQGRRMMNDGRVVTQESFLESSNREMA